MSLLEKPGVIEALFHPRKELSGTPPPSRGGVVSVLVDEDDGVFVRGRFHSGPSSDAPVLVFFHGNGEIAADYDPLAPLFVQLGVTFLVWDYRGYGASDGEPTAQALLDDAVVCFDAVPRLLKNSALTPRRFIVMGRSLGSAAALEVAVRTEAPLNGLIIESGFTDTFGLLARLGARIGGEEERNGFNNSRKIAKVIAPTLVIHGEDDVIIPVSEGRSLHTHAGATRRQLITIAGAGHNDLFLLGTARYLDAVRKMAHGEAVFNDTVDRRSVGKNESHSS